MRNPEKRRASHLKYDHSQRGIDRRKRYNEKRREWRRLHPEETRARSSWWAFAAWARRHHKKIHEENYQHG